MSGFDNETVYADGLDLSGDTVVTNKLGTDGFLYIGSSSGNPVAALLTSSDGSITWTAGSGTLDASVQSGGGAQTITGDSGGARPFDGSDNWDILGTTAQGITSAGSGSTLTFTVADSTTSQKGVLETSTGAESIAGSSTSVSVTPSSLGSKLGTQTANALCYGAGTMSAISWLGVATNGQIPVGSTGAAPVLASITQPAAGITFTGGSGSITVALADDLAGLEALAGTGLVSRTASDTYADTAITDHAFVMGEASEIVQMLGPGTNGQLPIASTGALPVMAAITGGAGITVTNGAGSISLAADLSDLVLYFSASDFDLVETAAAPLVQDDGTAVKHLVRAFDDTTEEFVNFSFTVPSDVESGSTITFRIWMYAATAAADKNIALTFGHSAIAESEDFDAAYTDEDSGDKAIDATQDNITIATWTETLANVGWAANDIVQCRLSRIDASTDDLSGDLYVMAFSVNIPRA